MSKILPTLTVVRKQYPASAIQWNPNIGHHWVRQPCGYHDEDGNWQLDRHGYVTELPRGGRELKVESGEWIVEEDGKRSIHSHESFHRLFVTVLTELTHPT